MKRAIVAPNGSNYGVTAARAAIEMAKRGEIEDLDFVHVVSLKPGQIGAKEYPDRPDLTERWPVFREPLAIARESGVRVRCVVLFGNVAEHLVRHARQNQVDLIILGSLGSSGIKEFLLGSVATRVAAHAPCSVMIVRPGFRLAGGAS